MTCLTCGVTPVDEQVHAFHHVEIGSALAIFDPSRGCPVDGAPLTGHPDIASWACGHFVYR